MEVVDERAGAPATPLRGAAAAPRGAGAVLGRVWDLPLAAHAAVLLAILVGLAAWAGTAASFVDDEGAAILQAQAIESGHWTLANPLPRADPRGAYYPLHYAAHGPDGFAPLGKHLFYGLLLAAAGRLAGVGGMVGLSLLGTVAAALLAARLAREVAPGTERTALWVVGLASPLFLDGFIVTGHTVGAALAAAAALLVLRYLADGGPVRLAAAAVALALACLVRTEAVLWAVGLAAGATAWALWARRQPAGGAHRRRGAACAAVVLGSAVVAKGLDNLLTDRALGVGGVSAGAPIAAQQGGGGNRVLGRVGGLWLSTLQARPTHSALVTGVGLAVGVAVAVVAVYVRRGGSRPAPIVATAAAAAGAVICLAVHDRSVVLSGLAVAFPLLWAGLWLLGRDTVRDPAAVTVVAATGVFAALVAVSQYSDAGAWQWGRFFFLAVPVIVPVVLGALRHHGRRMVPRVRGAVAGAAALLAVTTAASGAALVASVHRVTLDLARDVATVATTTTPGDGGRPVVATSLAFLPRVMWPVFSDMRWSLVGDGDMASYGRAVRRTGIRQLVLVGDDTRPEIAGLAASFRPVRTVTVGDGWTLVVLRSI